MSAHPAVDRATPRAWCVEQARPVVGLDALLVDALERSGGRQVALVTPATTRITLPLEAALARGPHRWVVRGAPFTNGLTGAPVRWDGAAFVDAGPAPAAPPGGPGGALLVDAAARHPADALTDVGGLAEAAAEVLLGGPPAGWGVTEPATRPWTRREPTRYCRDRAPRPSELVVAAGPRAVGLVTVRLGVTGVHERLRFACAAPADAGAAATAAALAAALAARGARSLTVVRRPGAVDGTRAPGAAPRPVPLGMLVDAARLRVPAGADPPFALVPVPGGSWARLDPADPHAALRRLTAALAQPGPVPGAVPD